MPFDPERVRILKEEEFDDYYYQECIIQLLNESKIRLQWVKNFLSISVDCSDVFAWGVADSEPVDSEIELEELYNLCVKYPMGETIWCCVKVKQKPQGPMEKLMREKNSWPAEIMDQLEENHYDKQWREALKEKGNEGF